MITESGIRVSKGSLILLLAGLSMLGALSTDMYLPSFHSMARDFGVGLDAIQQTLTVYLLAIAVTTLFHGTLSDAFGRKPVIVWSLVIFVVGSVGAALAPDLPVLIACRLLQGLSAGVGMVVGRAMVRDLFSGPEAQQIMAYTTVVFGVAPVIAPILGGWLEVGLGWRSVFVFLALFVTVLGVACCWRLPESLPVQQRIPLHLGVMARGYWEVGRDPRFLLQCLSIALTTSCLFLYISAAPVFVMEILKLSETSFGWLFIPLTIGIISGSFLAGRVARIWSPEKTIATGLVILVLAALGNYLYSAFCIPTVPWAVVPIMCCTFGMAFVSPAMTVLTLDLHPERRGLTSSLQSAFVMTGFSVFSGVVAPLLYSSAAKLALGALLGTLICAALWFARGWVPHRHPTAG